MAQATADDDANSGNSDYIKKFKDADHHEDNTTAKTERIEQGTSMVYWGTEYAERSNVKRHKFTIASYGESEVERDNDDRVVTYSEFKWTWEPDTEAYLVDPFPSEIGTKPGLPDSSDPYYDDLIYEVVDASVSIAWDSYGIYSDTQDILDAARNYYEGKKQDQSATYNWYWGEGIRIRSSGKRSIISPFGQKIIPYGLAQKNGMEILTAGTMQPLSASVFVKRVKKMIRLHPPTPLSRCRKTWLAENGMFQVLNQNGTILTKSL